MLKNYITTALRHFWRHKFYTAVNLMGLSIGLAIFLFANLLVDYESNFDTFWAKSDRIYILTEESHPSAGRPFNATLGARMPNATRLPTDSGIETWARSISLQYLVNVDDTKFYQDMRFVDPGFADMFDLNIVSGDPTDVYASPDEVIISETAAKKYFGDADPIGQILTVNLTKDLIVRAVFEDLPVNSYFTTSLIEDVSLEMITSTEALRGLSDWDFDNQWGSSSSSDNIFLLLEPGVTMADMEPVLDRHYDTHFPEYLRNYIGSVGLSPLKDANTFLWKATGMPIITTLQVMGALILGVACLNYANLATAQVMGRTREVGLRRTVGAGRSQLLSQFLSESILVCLIALLLAFAIIELSLPAVNAATGKAMSFPFLTQPLMLVQAIAISVAVGLLAGGYPAYMISKGQTVTLLKNEQQKGNKGVKTRSAMIILQFTISIFMMIAVAIIYAQNQQIAESALIFEKDRMVTLGRINRPEIAARKDTLRSELEAIPGIDNVAYARVLPYQQSNINSDHMMEPGNEATKIMFWRIYGNENFLSTMDFQIIAGRDLDINRSEDIWKSVADNGGNFQLSINVIANEKLTRAMGFDSPEQAIGHSFYQTVGDNNENRAYNIVGVMNDKNYMGFFNDTHPTYFSIQPDSDRYAVMKIPAVGMQDTLRAIEEVWNRVNPEYPIVMGFLDDEFQDGFSMFRGISMALAGFAALALFVAMIGLFGLAAFMAQKRTREIGIRKVLGASIGRITSLLVWQFSRPVVIAIVLATPLGYLAASMYLDFFAERVPLSPWLFVLTSILAMLLAAVTVCFHAVQAARTNPINSLRYE